MKIGVFDSGYGGLTVLNEFLKLLPDYNYVYLSDNARAPYGSKSFETVYEYTLQAVEYLFSKDCELIILACNTASAKALQKIQRCILPVKYPSKRVLGVIIPTVEIIDKISISKHVGILATAGTVKSKSYPIEIKKLFPKIKVFQQAAPMLVPIVEAHEIDSPACVLFIKEYIDLLMSQSKEIDTIILGCTHYPLLKHKIAELLSDNVKLVSQGRIVAESLKNYLSRHPEIEAKLDKNSLQSYYTTEPSSSFNENATQFCHRPIMAQTIIL